MINQSFLRNILVRGQLAEVMVGDEVGCKILQSIIAYAFKT